MDSRQKGAARPLAAHAAQRQVHVRSLRGDEGEDSQRRDLKEEKRTGVRVDILILPLVRMHKNVNVNVESAAPPRHFKIK